MIHGPHTLQIAYIDPELGPLALGGLTGDDPRTVSHTWSALRAPNASSRWQARLFDEHRTLLEEGTADLEAIERLFGQMTERLAQAREAAVFAN